MKFKVDKAVFDKYLNLYFYIPVIKGFNNKVDNLEFKTRISNMLFDGCGSLKSRFDTVEELMNDANTAAFLELFKNFGANNRTFPSHVAMALRVVEGANIPSINDVVDVYNSLSLKYFTPFGGEDLEKVYGDLVLKLAEGSETYFGIGSTENKPPKKGELIWTDDLDITCRALNWRQCERTKITPDSKVGYFIMDGVRVEDKENIENAAKELVERITEMMGGETMVLYLDKDNLEAEYDFETKTLTEEDKIKQKENSNKKEVNIKGVKEQSKIKEYKFPKNSIAYKLQGILAEALKSKFNLEMKPEEIHLENPKDETHGDYASNIAMMLAKELGRNPKEIAHELARSDMRTAQCTIDIAGPGFLNFKVNNDLWFEALEKKEDTNILDEGEKKKIMVEMGDPNTHKIPHIGHLFSYISGSAISNILEAQGHEIFRVYYGGDVGMHVAKALYGWIQKEKPRPEGMMERVKLVQECYQEGSALYEEDDHKAKIQQINKDIYNPKSEIQADWKETRQWSLDYYVEFEKMLGIHLDKHYVESMVFEEGLRIIKENTGKIFEESEGAVIFPGEKYGLHNRVFITKQGTPTYEAKDMGLCLIKKKDYDYDLTVIPTANEQNEYFKVLIEAINQTLPEIKDKVMHIGFGMVSLSTGKMSSRSGKILSAPELVEKVIAAIGEKIKDREDLSAEEKSDISKKVGLGAIKYSFLKIGLTKNRAFDIEESVSAEGDSAPYIMYSYARASSVLRTAKSEIRTAEATDIAFRASQNMDLSEDERSLLVHIGKYEETILSAGINYAPNVIANYLYNLAQKFNNFYNKHQILKAENEEVKQSRLLLTQATAQVLKNGLKLLGIETVEKM
jgi:arginyl-tRNA synthetase